MKHRPPDDYIMEKIEAYNVAISALGMHESADPHPTGLDRKLRDRLLRKLQNEIDRWCDQIPPP